MLPYIWPNNQYMTVYSYDKAVFVFKDGSNVEWKIKNKKNRRLWKKRSVQLADFLCYIKPLYDRYTFVRKVFWWFGRYIFAAGGNLSCTAIFKRNFFGTLRKAWKSEKPLIQWRFGHKIRTSRKTVFYQPWGSYMSLYHILDTMWTPVQKCDPALENVTTTNVSNIFACSLTL